MGFGKKAEAAPALGYKPGFAEAFAVQQELGRGGNGIVRRVTHIATGRCFAAKSIPKVLDDPAASERKKAEQIPYLKREVEVLLALRGTLNVANLEEVYEDATHVHIVLELCSGGELVAATAKGRHYSERTAASYLRAVLRTVAQCHAKRIIHRDIKPENFLLLSDDPAAPLKSIDFGLGVFFDPQQLPVTGLNPEGTPWYLAPECCRAKWHPVSDVWAVGIMSCYLLTGAYPFLDRVSPKMPDLARTLRSICFEELDLNRQEFGGLSSDARAFIQYLLVKDLLKRPSAADALRHPFLRGGCEDRAAGKPLDQTVVQRIQRFASSSLFKRTVLEHIAADLLRMHFAPEPSTHGGKVFLDRSTRGGKAFAAAERSVHGEREGSVPGDKSIRGMASAAMAAVRGDRSVRGGDRSARGMREGSAGGVREGSTRGMRESSVLGGDKQSLKGMTLAALAAMRERSVHGGDRSTRGGDRSTRGGDRSARGGQGGSAHSGREGGMRREGSMRALDMLTRAGSTQLDPSVRSASVFLPIATPYSHRLAQLFDQLQLQPGQKMDCSQLQKGLQKIGYKLQEAEVGELFSVVDVEQRGEISREELAAGLIDWKAFQDTYKDRWLEAARRAFAELDAGGTGQLGSKEIAAAFGSHLQAYEVDAAVHQALLEAAEGRPGGPAGEGSFDHSSAANGGRAAGGQAAGGGGGGEAAAAGDSRISFDNFLCLLRYPSSGVDELDLDKFDARLSNHTSRQVSMWADDLKPVKAQQGGGCCAIS